jgi:hypothetical protein
MWPWDGRGAEIRILQPLLQCSKLGRCEIGDGTEGTGHCAMIIKAALVGDVCYGPVGFCEQASRAADPGLHDQLIGTESENTLDQACKSNGRQAGAARQRTGGEGFVAVCFEVFKGTHQTWGNDFAKPGGAQITGNADDADNGALIVAHGKLGGQTPSWASMRVPMQFEMIDHCAAGTQNGLVLGGIEIGEFPRKDLPDLSSQELAFVLQTAAVDQGLVNCQVAPSGVFDEERRLRNVIEQLFDNGQLSGD